MDATRPFGGAWGRRGAPPGNLQGAFLLGAHFFQGDSEKVMFLESVLLSGCNLLLLYSTAGWVEGERGTSVGLLCTLYSAFFY